ncbi:ribonuclease [Nocardia cyriacigeorgica]|uniref:Ribonuclease n=1 Tax=Nocardia cyriacigeorgica TaxID=135487 RepID=A0ABX0CWW4_9NOCA|nr:ribonuclease domain-containing protein [Nocardia cyriacigeorgica]NEW41154.1 ribonuclease [Nocardia cyriacigeorgica]NEW58049.1 ribonuclease [Nocardia cyriacigeorgica]
MKAKVIRVLSAVGTVVLAVLVALLATKGGDDTSTDASTTSTRAAVTSAASPADMPRDTGKGSTAPVASKAPGVPDRAYTTLGEIDAGRWPGSANSPGTKGGDRFYNRGGDLPAKDSDGKAITYQEWDVNPKQPGRSRDAERIVTGSDGSAWYTGDHYETFTRMR